MEQPEDDVKADPKGAIAFAIVSIFYLIGIYHAWNGANDIHSPIDPRLSTIAATSRSTVNPSPHQQLLCNTPFNIHITHFKSLTSPPPSKNKPQLSITDFIEQQISPSIKSVSSIIHPVITSSEAYYTSDAAPSDSSQNNEDQHQDGVHILSEAQAYSLGHKLLRETLPTDKQQASVLVVDGLFSIASSSPPSSKEQQYIMQITDNALLVLLNQKSQDNAASRIISWLTNNFIPPLPNTDDNKNNNDDISKEKLEEITMEISRICLHSAAHMIDSFVLSTSHASGGVSSKAARLSTQVADAYTIAQERSEQEYGAFHGSYNINAVQALESSRKAWKAAVQLSTTVDFGVETFFPSEHKMALLLPIGLPTAIILLQFVKRQVQVVKQQRKKLKQL